MFSILVIDDEPNNFDVIETFLGDDRYRLHYAASGQDAFQSLDLFNPDLILLDVMMPGINGYEVCHRLKQDERTRLIPVIFLTALNDRQARLQGIEAGADDFLTKPFDRVELSARVKSLVRQRRLNEDLDHAGQVLFSIARTIESRDPNTGDHCERLIRLGQDFGTFLQISHRDFIRVPRPAARIATATIYLPSTLSTGV